jgi:hypothetical protein
MTDEKRIDESWKEKAKAESGPKGPEAGESTLKDGEATPSGPATISSLIASLATGALMALGGDADEQGKPIPPDLPRARYAIDLLDVLAGKTKGNLTPEEDRSLTSILHRLRMAYVEATRKPSA